MNPPTLPSVAAPEDARPRLGAARRPAGLSLL
jgi:hypothetical protein